MVNYELLINSWTQGQIDQNDKVIRVEINRGGLYQLNIKLDTTAIFSAPFSCGFGHERQGKWIVNKMDKTIIFTFTKKVGYLNSPGTTNINEIEIYKIRKLTIDELILTQFVDGKERTMQFIKAEN